MKKKCLSGRALQLFSLFLTSTALLLSGCTTLDYVSEDYADVKKSNVQTNELFSFSTYEKTIGAEQSIKAGISETQLENALVLYIGIKNYSDKMYKFDMADIQITSPIGEVSVIPPNQYIDAYQNYEASNYANLAGMSTTLNQFANVQNQYRRTNTVNDSSRLENNNIAPELMQLEGTIRGIQKHTLSTYKFINPNSEEYYYIFIRKPDEYPIVVKYKDLTYKFGGKKNAQQ